MPKFILLLLVREFYLFSRNLYGLIFHPYKTMRAIRREEDLSQAAILSSWPISLWVPLSVLFVLIKFFLRPVGFFNQGLSFLFALATLFTLGYVLYLVSWLIFYFQINRKAKS